MFDMYLAVVVFCRFIPAVPNSARAFLIAHQPYETIHTERATFDIARAHSQNAIPFPSKSLGTGVYDHEPILSFLQRHLAYSAVPNLMTLCKINRDRPSETRLICLRDTERETNQQSR